MNEDNTCTMYLSGNSSADNKLLFCTHFLGQYSMHTEDSSQSQLLIKQTSIQDKISSDFQVSCLT